MIKLVSKKYKSALFTHPVVAGGSSISYTVNHNLKEIPDSIKLFWSSTSILPYRDEPDRNPSGSDTTGYEIRSSTPTSSTVWVYRLLSSPVSCYFVAYAF